MCLVLDRDYNKDREICPLCKGGFIDTDLSNAFGLGLNADSEMKNPYNFFDQHRMHVNFQIGKSVKGRETLEQLFGKLL